jgi:hypothetical protein
MTRRHLVLTLCLGLAACGNGGASDGDAGPDAQVSDGGNPDANTAGCDPVAQTGCASDQKCSLLATTDGPDVVACVDGSGTRQALQTCTPATTSSPDDCAPGLACRGAVDPRCLTFCDSSPEDTCGAEESCIFVEDLDGDLLGDVEYCARTCDLLDQDCPGVDIGCYPTRDGPVCAPIGAGDLPGQLGDYCAFANSCDVGLGCFYVSTDWFCLEICDYFESGGPTCGVDEVCNRHEDDDWGVCVSAF